MTNIKKEVKDNTEVWSLERCPMHSDEVVAKLKEAKDKGQLEESLIRLFGSYEMDMLIIWKCRDFFRACSEEFYRNHPHMIAFRAIIEAMGGHLDRAGEIVGWLGKTPDDLSGYQLKELDFVRMMLELVMPQYDNAEFVKRAKFLTSYSHQPIKGLALTACRPSVINGFRDMTEFCPDMETKSEEIIDNIFAVYGNSGKGVYEVALAEWKYETGDSFNSLLLVAGTIPALEFEKDIRCLFAAYVLQMRILLFGGQTRSTSEMFDKIRQKILDRRYEELEASLEAAICLFNCYEGNYPAINEWLQKKAPNENNDFFMMDIFSYLVKMRCYLQTGKHMMTLLLAKKLILYLSESYRPHDTCECLILLAMACLKAGDKENAYIEFDKALKIGSEHGYVRVFGDEGQIMIELLGLYSSKVSKKEAINVYDSKWLKKIKGVALEVGNRFPDYLKSEKEQYSSLSKSEQQVLHMVAKGMKNSEIATQLEIKLVTVKFHITNIYKKLMVENRQQAVNKAREVGYL